MTKPFDQSLYGTPVDVEYLKVETGKPCEPTVFVSDGFGNTWLEEQPIVLDSPLAAPQVTLPVDNMSPVPTGWDQEVSKLGGGVKYDIDKVRLDLIPFESLAEIAKVLMHGEKKYHAWNWAQGMSWVRMAAAILRHLGAWLAGQDNDPDSGLSHLSHAGCMLLFLIWHEQYKPELDDRRGSGDSAHIPTLEDGESL